MGSVYRRKGTRMYWVAFYDAEGKRALISSGETDAEKALLFLEAIERRIAAEKAAGIVTGPITVKRWAESTWLPGRRKRGLISVQNDENKLQHAFKHVGHLELKAVRPSHLKAMVRALESAGELSPRSILHVYNTLRTLFADAVAEELIAATPCVLRQRRGELPAKRDKDPNWRSGAIFTRSEAEALMSDERIPAFRRMLYVILFLSGMRVGEAVARRWRDYDTKTEPLGTLTVGSHWDLAARLERPATKTGNSRLVPVHPELARSLATWRLNGWAEHMGRRPTQEDLIVPGVGGNFLNIRRGLEQLKIQLESMGLRKRRIHDMRRTFISLAQADGADRFLLKWVTHGAPGDVIGDYTTLPWETLCNQVAVLRLSPITGKLLHTSPAARRQQLRSAK